MTEPNKAQIIAVLNQYKSIITLLENCNIPFELAEEAVDASRFLHGCIANISGEPAK